MPFKILILFPNTSNDGVIPLAVGILSSLAKKRGCEVRYFETTFYNKSNTATEDRESTGEFKAVQGRNKKEYPPLRQMFSDFETAIAEFSPNVLAVHANSLEWEMFKEIMSHVRLPNPVPLVLVGGVHATLKPDAVMAEPYIDVVCMGEGENAWAEFLDTAMVGGDISAIQNLWVRTKHGVRKNPLRPLIPAEQLWNTPIDYSLFDERHLLKPFDGEMRNRGLIEYSRGCPFNCHYCVNSAFRHSYLGLGTFFRVRPFANFQQGVLRLVALGAEILQLQDECFLSNKTENIQRFCTWYAQEIRLPLLLQTRPESITDDKVRMLAEMNLPVQISLGVESGSERILREMCNRKMSIASIQHAFEVIHKYGLRSNAYCMIGFPTETRDEVFETIRLVRGIQPTVAIMSVFYPFVGVPLRQLCVERGFIEGTESARTFTDDSILRNQPLSAEEIKNIRRCFRLYTKLPEKYFPQIEACEKDPAGNRKLFAELVEISWSEEALSHKPREA